jgi:hypothetical protein
MSENKKTYCSLYTFVKRTNGDLYSILDDTCTVGLFRSRNDITFLNPNETLTKEIVKMVDKGHNEEAAEKVKSLFIYGKHTSLNKDVVNYNNKKYKDDISKLKVLSEFKQFKDNQNASVFDYTFDEFPKESEEVPRPSMNKSRGKGKKGREDNNKKMLYTHELMNEKNYSTVIYALNSLLGYVKKNDEKTFNTVKNLIDPNMILSWYILVQPGKENTPYISNDMFNDWVEKNALDELPKDKDVLEVLINKTETPNGLLKESKKKRDMAKENEYDLDECKKTILEIYENNMTKLLEDELRFRYSDEECDEMFENYVCTLTMIDWNNPADSLVLLKNINNMHNSAVLVCLQKFINSSAFNYTLINNEMYTRVTESISGAGSGKGKKMIKFLGHNHRNTLKNTKSVKTIERIESMLNHLTPKERSHLKSIL